MISLINNFKNKNFYETTKKSQNFNELSNIETDLRYLFRQLIPQFEKISDSETMPNSLRNTLKLEVNKLYNLHFNYFSLPRSFFNHGKQLILDHLKRETQELELDITSMKLINHQETLSFQVVAQKRELLQKEAQSQHDAVSARISALPPHLMLSEEAVSLIHQTPKQSGHTGHIPEIKKDDQN